VQAGFLPVELFYIQVFDSCHELVCLASVQDCYALFVQFPLQYILHCLFLVLHSVFALSSFISIVPYVSSISCLISIFIGFKSCCMQNLPTTAISIEFKTLQSLLIIKMADVQMSSGV